MKRWLSEYYGKKSASYYNSALTVLRAAFDVAVNDKIISESPAKSPNVSQAQRGHSVDSNLRTVQDHRGRRSRTEDHREAEQSGDFIEFMGLAGLGQADISAIGYDCVGYNEILGNRRLTSFLLAVGHGVIATP